MSEIVRGSRWPRQRIFPSMVSFYCKGSGQRQLCKALPLHSIEVMPDLINEAPDFFKESSSTQEPRGSDPWSDQTWGQNALNVTFETLETDVFEFSAGESLQNGDSPEDVEFSLFRGGTAATLREVKPEKKKTGPPLVGVAVHEQLSATYDDASEEPSSHLEGTVTVRATTDMSRHPFCLVIRDLLGHIEVLEDRTLVSKDVSQQISRKGLHRSDRVIRISLPATSTRKDVQVARYICTTRLRPVPLVSGSFCVHARKRRNNRIKTSLTFLFPSWLYVAGKKSCSDIQSTQPCGFQNKSQSNKSRAFKTHSDYASYSTTREWSIGQIKSKGRSVG